MSDLLERIAKIEAELAQLKAEAQQTALPTKTRGQVVAEEEAVKWCEDWGGPEIFDIGFDDRGYLSPVRDALARLIDAERRSAAEAQRERDAKLVASQPVARYLLVPGVGCTTPTIKRDDAVKAIRSQEVQS